MLYRGAKILILDEPTAVLVPQEVEALFANLRELKAQGATILFIDHKLLEVLEIADTSPCFARVAPWPRSSPKTSPPADLAELMVGSELPSPTPPSRRSPTRSRLSLSDVTVVENERPVVDRSRSTSTEARSSA